jgi:putative PIN family toxin of toxin-antitoxin system
VFTLCLSQKILDELRSTLLERRRIRRRYHYTDAQVHELCQDLERVADMVAESPAVRVVERDPNDDMVVACAVEGRVDYVVTRDKDLLSLSAYRDVRMVTPRQLLDLLAGSSAR